MFAYNEVESCSRRRRLGMVLAIIAALLVMYRSQLQPPIPGNDAVFGCYTNDRAPAIKLDSAGMHIAQSGFPIIPFHIERHKTGYALTADKPIQAEPIANGFSYSFYKPGAGTFLPLFRVVDGRTYGSTDEKNLQGFSMLAEDGTNLNYMSGPKEACSMANS